MPSGLAGRAVETALLLGCGTARLGIALVANRGRPRASVVADAAVWTLERLGPTYIKLGQILATRRDLLPECAALELERLQDRVGPARFDHVRPLFRSELGVDPADVFAELDPVPIACGGVACVYRGALRDGTPVAVKVRRPDVARRIDLDLRLLRIGARMLRLLPPLRRLPLVEALEEFGTGLRRQIDFRLEGDANRRIRAAMRDDPNIVVPRLVDELSSESLLTMELLPVERASRDQRCLPALVAALRALYRMIFIDGFVHCDLHGANLFLFPNGQAVLLDFGFVAELPTETRLTFAEFFLAMASDDGRRCARITVETASYVPSNLDYRVFEGEVCRLVTRASGASIEEFSVAGFVGGLFDIQRRHRIVGTSDFVMAIVALLVFEGTAKSVAGSVDFGREAVPFVMHALGERMEAGRAVALAEAQAALTG
ncbi:MAG: ABC1 kinase family protein [Gaiellaceae bacterium]